MGKVSIGIGKKGMRSCGTCTKCCEGWLMATIAGEEMYPGKPCQLLDPGKGCSDYKNRPEDPCKTFNCMWRVDHNLPKEFSPQDTGVIVTTQNVNGIDYLAAVYAGKEIEADFLSWFVAYCVSRRINFEWTIRGQALYIGSDEFKFAMDQRYGIKK